MKKIVLILVLVAAICLNSQADSLLDLTEFGISYGKQANVPDGIFGANIGLVAKKMSFGIEIGGNGKPPKEDIDDERKWDWGDWGYVDSDTIKIFSGGLYGIRRIDFGRYFGTLFLFSVGISSNSNYEKNYDFTLHKYWYTLIDSEILPYGCLGIGLRFYCLEIIAKVIYPIGDSHRISYFGMINFPLKYIDIIETKTFSRSDVEAH